MPNLLNDLRSSFEAYFLLRSYVAIENPPSKSELNTVGRM